ncbi:MAG: adenylate/guanylate cyclase domain-containing protein, partial [Dongiaceae bacterium]
MDRKLAAILAADVVGYGRMIEADKAGAQAALNDRRSALFEPKIDIHHGRIARLTGDGFLVEFASVVNALQCAVELQQGMAESNAGLPEPRRMRLRIGIAIGDIAVDEDDIRGDGVDVAARLEPLADPGSILIAGPVYDQVKNKLRLSYLDLGPQTLQNIAEPVRAYKVALGAPGTATEPSGADSLPLPSKPSVAVLPFANFSGDPSQTYFSDGITEDIITQLSRFRELFVIARYSSFVYRDRAINVQQVGRELGVRYVLEGSVRRAGTRVRITAELDDAATGRELWTQRYDRELVDIFAVQDEVTRSIVSALALRIEDERLLQLERRTLQNMQAYDCWLHGKRHLERRSAEGLAAARVQFEKAIELDAWFARAYAGLAAVLNRRVFYVIGDMSFRDAHERALEHAQKAVSLDDADHLTHMRLGWSYLWCRRFPEARRHLDIAAELNPNDIDTMTYRATALAFLGEPAAAIEEMLTAIRLNPHHGNSYLEDLA